MAKGPKEYIEYFDKVLPWVDHVEFHKDDFYELVTLKEETPQEIKDLFDKLEPKLRNTEWKR